MKTTQPPEGTPRVYSLATASLFLGIASFFLLCFGPLAALPAVVTGHVA